MKRIAGPATFVFLLAVSVAVVAQPAHQTQPTTTTTPTSQETASRDATREKMRALLDTTGPKINVAFKQSDKNPYNFVGIMSTGLTIGHNFTLESGFPEASIRVVLNSIAKLDQYVGEMKPSID